MFVVAWQRRNTTENVYKCLLNWLPWKHTPCVIVRLLLKFTTMYVVFEYKLFEENPLIYFQISDNLMLK